MSPPTWAEKVGEGEHTMNKYYSGKFVMEHFSTTRRCEGTITYKGRETAIVTDNDECTATTECLVQKLLADFENKSLSEAIFIINTLNYAGIIVDGINGKKDTHEGRWHVPMKWGTVIWYEDGYRHEYRV